MKRFNKILVALLAVFFPLVACTEQVTVDVQEMDFDLKGEWELTEKVYYFEGREMHREPIPPKNQRLSFYQTNSVAFFLHDSRMALPYHREGDRLFIAGFDWQRVDISEDSRQLELTTDPIPYTGSREDLEPYDVLENGYKVYRSKIERWRYCYENKDGELFYLNSVYFIGGANVTYDAMKDVYKRIK